jgi:hypothetical protein
MNIEVEVEAPKGYEFLKNYQMPFLANLNELCKFFVTIGSRDSESPTWIQYRGLSDFENASGNTIRFISSQLKDIGFELKVINEVDFHNFRGGDYTVTYNYFKALKRDFLKSQYPTIKLN